VWSIDGAVLSASDSYARLVGMTADEILGRRWPDLVPDEATFAWQQLRFSVEALRTAPVLVVDMPTQASGSTTWLRWTEWAIRDTRGELVQVRSTAVDVSELHETRAALAATVDAVAAARAAGRQEVAEQLHNGAVQQLTAARWALSDGDVHGALSLVDAALSAVRTSVDALDPPQVGVSLVSDADLPAAWVAHPASFSGDDVQSWLSGAGTSVFADAVLVFSSAGVVWASEAARTLLGDPIETIDLASMVTWVHPADRVAMATAVTAGLAGEHRRLTLRFRHPRLGWRHLATRFVPLEWQDRRPLTVAFTVDITDALGEQVLAARDAERERLAADLHDDALQHLAGVRWLLSSHDIGDDALGELNDLETSIRSQVARLLSRVDESGLESALDQLAARCPTPATTRYEGDLSTVPLEVADRVWRAARELLRNVDQHADALRASVEVAVTDDRLALSVTDDGVGFGPHAWALARRAGHVGLAALREAAFASGGAFSVSTGPAERGTCVCVEFPLS
jgi:PAS domain S-box-containing protein